MPPSDPRSAPPTPNPPGPVASRAFLTAQWRRLLMLNFTIDRARVEPFVPRGVEIDTYQGDTFASVVGFLFLDTRLLGIPVPGHRRFEELNLRLYVRREVDGQVRRGVVFVKEIVPRWAIASVARWVYNENYVSLPMRHEPAGWTVPSTCESVEYAWRYAGRWNRVSATAQGSARPLAPGSLEEFIAEHYWGYCRQRDGGTIEYRVEHVPWQVWDATHVRWDIDVASLYGETFVPVLQVPPASALIADGSAISVGRPRRIG